MYFPISKSLQNLLHYAQHFHQKRFVTNLNLIEIQLFLYYDKDIREVEMDFFRNNKKLIVGFILVAVVLWMVGFSVLAAILSMGN